MHPFASGLCSHALHERSLAHCLQHSSASGERAHGERLRVASAHAYGGGGGGGEGGEGGGGGVGAGGKGGAGGGEGGMQKLQPRQ
eukprot:1183980-Prymnesium_polylepis.2